MKDRKDWGPADELANTYMNGIGIAVVLMVLWLLYAWMCR